MQETKKKYIEVTCSFIEYVSKLFIEDKISLQNYILYTKEKIDFLNRNL